MGITRTVARSSRILHDSITIWQLADTASRRGYEPVAAPADSASTLYAGELEIRLGEGLVLATGRALRLSVREFGLLAALAQRAGAIVSRDELYEKVWGGKLRTGDRSVDVYVSKLRGKLEAAMPDRRFIHTHPGFGYRFQPQPARETGIAPGTSDPAERADSTGPRPEGLSRNVHIGAVGD
jgi:DNA-binding response OmpR family regulator